MEVHNALGSGFPEVIYQRALNLEFYSQGLLANREVEVPIYYKDVLIGTRRVDFLVNDFICVELKAVSQMEARHLAQAINYLEAFRLEIGLLINFGSGKLQFRRVYNNKIKDKTRMKG